MSGNATQLITESVRILEPTFGQEAVDEASKLISALLAIPIWKLRVDPDAILISNTDKERVLSKVALRSRHFPLQYIIGKTWFYWHEFKVGEGVLIPRGDTERLVEEAYKICSADYARELYVLEFCTGSGCVGISLADRLAVENIRMRGVLTDLSDKALEYANDNIKIIRPGNDLKIIRHDLMKDPLTPIRAISERYRLIIANPPYIKSSDLPNLQDEVKLYEPAKALDGGEDGLKFYRKIIEHAPLLLEDDGILLMEIGFDARDQVSNLLISSGNFDDPLITNDYSGNPRVISAHRKIHEKAAANL